MTTRRTFLLRVAGGGVAAASLGALPQSIQRALAIPANNTHGSIRDVEHVIILTQENRSFDNYFGTLRGVRGFGDRFTIPLPGGRTVWQQMTKDERILYPYALDSSRGNAQRVSGTPHSWIDGADAWDGGRADQWPRHKTEASMGYFTEQELPFQFALAEAFTICDAYHCAMHTGTNSNRMFLWTGSNGPSAAGVASVNNEWDDIDRSDRGYTWTTYPERLQEAGVSWIVYQNMPDNFTDNPLAGFVAYRRANEASGKPVSADDNQVSPPYDPASDDTGNPLYKGIANTLPGSPADPGTYLDRFRADIRNGRLPQVSWLVAPTAYSEHPGPSSPVQGAWFIQEVLDALTAVPEVWSKTVLFVNFDENDGYFDHYPSPAAPSIDADGLPAGKTTLPEADLNHERFTQPPAPGTVRQPPADGRVFGPGIRVPMYVVSPWSRGGWVNSETFDHTSVLRFLEARFGVREANIAPFRRAVCGDLTSAFNFRRPNDEPLPVLAGRRTREQADALRKAHEALAQISPPAVGRPPVQALGVRPSRALPYDLQVRAQCSAADGRIQLAFANHGRAGAVFHVYDRLHLDRLPRRYAVESDRELDDHWNTAGDAGRYDLWVLGPNGFHRHIRGDLGSQRSHKVAVPEIDVHHDCELGRLRLTLRNDGTVPCGFLVLPNRAYGVRRRWGASVAPGRSTSRGWSLKRSGHWYDFSVVCNADPAFERRLAGRIETGEHTISDPAMGLADVF